MIYQKDRGEQLNEDQLRQILERHISRRQIMVFSGMASAAGFLAACGGTSNLGQGGGGKPSERKTLKLGHVNATTSHIHLAALKFAEVAKAKSNGSLEIQVFPTSQLGSNVQMIEACRTGTQDLCFPSAAETANTAKEWAIYGLPTASAHHLVARGAPATAKRHSRGCADRQTDRLLSPNRLHPWPQPLYARPGRGGSQWPRRWC